MFNRLRAFWPKVTNAEVAEEQPERRLLKTSNAKKILPQDLKLQSLVSLHCSWLIS